MSTANDQEFIARTTRTSQFIIGSLTMGLVIFMGLVILVPLEGVGAPPEKAAAPQTPIFTYMALAFGVTGLLVSIVIPKVVATAERRKIAQGSWSPPGQDNYGQAGPSQEIPGGGGDDTAKLVAVYQTQLIIGAALNEGAGLLAIIAYMLEHNPVDLGLAILLIL